MGEETGEASLRDVGAGARQTCRETHLSPASSMTLSRSGSLFVPALYLYKVVVSTDFQSCQGVAHRRCQVEGLWERRRGNGPALAEIWALRCWAAKLPAALT